LTVTARKRPPGRVAPTTEPSLLKEIPPMNALYSKHSPDPVAALRALVDRYPEAIYKECSELAQILGHPEAGIEEARRWMLEDELEIRA
jgi:hypothetical protein